MKDQYKYKRYLNVDDLSQYTSFGKSFIYKMVEQDEIPFLRVKKRIVFDREEIDRWIHNEDNSSIDLPTLKF
jgi:excisionase family DNA binding protein